MDCKHQSMSLTLMCYIFISGVLNVNIVLSYKKPTFCYQDVEPFSFLWSIKRDPPSYLFGTIHVPYTRVWDYIPDNAKQAFATSSRVYFELDLVNPTTVSALSSCQMLPQGKNLSDVLPGDLYARLKRHLEYVRGMMPRWMTADQKGRGLYYADYLFNAIAGNWERKRPVWVMLMVNSLTESDVRSRGVPVLDLYLAQESERMKKKTAAVEKVEEQCLPLNGLNFSQVLFALNHTLLQHELRENDPTSSTYTTDDLIRHYNCGDLDSAMFGTDTAALPPLPNITDAALARNIDLYFRSELIDNRNRRMGSRVVQLIRENPGQSLFFAFGAGHFLGNNTVLDFVQDHGFEVEHLSVNAKISKSSPDLPEFKPSGSFDSTRKGQKRRSSRQKSFSAFQKSTGLKHMIDTTSPSTPDTTPKSRLFNDLWIRMDTYKRESEKPSAEKTGTPWNAFQKWTTHHEPDARDVASKASALNLISLFCWLTWISQLCVSHLTGIT